jgi:hypothetical protein
MMYADFDRNRAKSVYHPSVDDAGFNCPSIIDALYADDIDISIGLRLVSGVTIPKLIAWRRAVGDYKQSRFRRETVTQR